MREQVAELQKAVVAASQQQAKVDNDDDDVHDELQASSSDSMATPAKTVRQHSNAIVHAHARTHALRMQAALEDCVFYKAQNKELKRKVKELGHSLARFSGK